MDQVLAVLVIVAIWALVLLASPTTRCGCAGRCRRCKGTGRRFRLGAQIFYRGAEKGHKEARRRWPRA
jgi:hypothetical protein